MPDSWRTHGLQPTRLLSPWDFPGKDTGVGCHFLLQGIFPTQRSNPGLLTAGRFFTDWATREVCGSRNGMSIRQSFLQPYIPQTGTPVFWKAQARSWSLGVVEQSQGEGCCSLRRDLWRGCEGGDCGGKCLWRKARQPWKQGDTAKSRVAGGAITIASLSPHASTNSWTVKTLAHQTPNTRNYRAGPLPGCPCKCRTRRSAEEDPTRGVPLCAWGAEQQRRTSGKGAL